MIIKKPCGVPQGLTPGLPPLSNAICGCTDDLEMESMQLISSN